MGGSIFLRPRSILCNVTEATVDNAAPDGLRHWLHVRWRLAYFTALLGLLLYLGRAVVQVLLIRQETPFQDFPQFYNAAVQLNLGHSPYSAFLTACPGHHWCLGGYIYPPLLAELLRPLALLDETTAALIWVALSHLMLLGAAIIAYRTVAPWLSRGAAPLLAAASLFFLPLYQSLHAEQVGTMLLLILAVGAHAFVRRGGRAGAGLALAIGSVLRVSPAAMAPLLLRTRQDRRRPVGLLVMAVSGVALLALLYLLTPSTVEYFREVLPRVSSGTGVPGNVSLPGALIRIEILATGSAWSLTNGLDPLILAAAVGITWWGCRGRDDARFRAAAFAAFLAVIPVASALTWNYHLINEPLVYALLAPSLIAGNRAWWLAVASYPLLWLYGDGMLLTFGINRGSLLGAAAFLVVTSVNLLGAVLLWLASLDVLARLRADQPHPAI
jgi:Glycosyltransferase family 87